MEGFGFPILGPSGQAAAKAGLGFCGVAEQAEEKLNVPRKDDHGG